MIKGIDVSAWQGNIDWKQVAADGIEFAIIKAGGSDAGKNGWYKDKQFMNNIIGAFSNGIHVGAYYFVGKNCTNADAGRIDAQRFLYILQGLFLDYPVVLDFEAPTRDNKQGNTDAVKAFCEEMEKNKYYVSIYASDISGFKERLYIDQLTAYDKWVARYGSDPKYVKQWGMWQYSSKGNLHGIKGFVDMDYSKQDYSKIIPAAHLNGF